MLIMRPIPRRRFLSISAAAAGMPLLPTVLGPAQATTPNLHIWRGAALGADAMLQIHHPDPATAQRLIDLALAEVERLERVFSLYRADSAISRLNRHGELLSPPADLVALLSQSINFRHLTDGAFDVTIQPLWRLYAEHFSQADAAPGGPPRHAVIQMLERVDSNAIDLDPLRIRFRRKGMMVSMNGIAQGYITDRVVEILRNEGIGTSLIDMGEIRALDGRPDGRPWLAQIEAPVELALQSGLVELQDVALATSGGYGLSFDTTGQFNHILDPRTGACAPSHLMVSVIAPTATTADALSTAFSLMPLERTFTIAEQMNAAVRFSTERGVRASSSWPA